MIFYYSSLKSWRQGWTNFLLCMNDEGTQTPFPPWHLFSWSLSWEGSFPSLRLLGTDERWDTKVLNFQEKDTLSVFWAQTSTSHPQEKVFYRFNYKKKPSLLWSVLPYPNKRYRSLHDRASHNHVVCSQAQPLGRAIWLNVARETCICCHSQEGGLFFCFVY